MYNLCRLVLWKKNLKNHILSLSTFASHSIFLWHFHFNRICWEIFPFYCIFCTVHHQDARKIWIHDLRCKIVASNSFFIDTFRKINSISWKLDEKITNKKISSHSQVSSSKIAQNLSDRSMLVIDFFYFVSSHHPIE